MDVNVDRTDRKRRASSPWQMTPSAWKEVASRVWNECWVDNIGLVAAGVAFYGFLAVVPLLGILVLGYGMVTDPATVVNHVMVMIHILPSDVAMLIGRLLMNAVQTSEQTKGLGFLVAILVGLYAGGNGAGAVMAALNIAYEEEEKRSLSRFYAIAFTFTAAAVLLALVALAATAMVQALDRLIPHLSGTALVLGKAGLYVLIGLIAAAVAATLYRYGPSREGARWQWLTPGSIFTAAVWLILTNSFGFYVTRLTDYNAIYGSIAATVMLLTWMYLSAYVFLFGAELNAELERQTDKDDPVRQQEEAAARPPGV